MIKNLDTCALVDYNKKEKTKQCRCLSANYCLTEYDCPFFRSKDEYMTVIISDKHGNPLKAIKPKYKQKEIKKVVINRTSSGTRYDQVTKVINYE